MVVVSSTFSAPAEGIILQTPGTKLIVNDQELGTGTLFITEHNVVWGGGAAPSVALLYPTISLHAVQREPTPALYMVINYDLRLPELPAQQAGGGDSNDDDDNDDFDPDDQPITQLRFIPANEADLQPMYSAMSQGQALHPDPADEVDDDDPYMDGEEFEEAEDEFEDAEESEPSAGVAGAAGAGGAGGADDAASRLRHLRLANTNGTHRHDGMDEAEDADITEE